MNKKSNRIVFVGAVLLLAAGLLTGLMGCYTPPPKIDFNCDVDPSHLNANILKEAEHNE